MMKAKSLELDPSLFGDSGLFAPYVLFQMFCNAVDEKESSKNVVIVILFIT